MTLIQLPGLIDPHVHLRDPGSTHKEDWDSGTAAALAGGFTCVLDMPNNSPPVVDAESLAAKRDAARERARCDYGFHLGANDLNFDSTAALASQVVGLKMYLDQTFGPLRMDSLAALTAHARSWPPASPLLCHAEGRTLAAAILAACVAGRSIHICHVSRREEIELVRAVKNRGMQVTCEVTPHHLFLTDADAHTMNPGRGEVRPTLGTSADRDSLRANLDIIDCFATDHAPHTLVEKDSANPPPGFPGLETALPWYLQLVRDGSLTMGGLIERAVLNPRRIFGVPEQPDTFIEVDTESEWTVRGVEMFTRAHWSPFEGWKLKGRVQRVVIRGSEAFNREKNLIAASGSGRNIRD